jgi:hypothetical protein
LLPDMALQIEKMSIFIATSTHDASDLVGSDSNRSAETTQSKSFSDLEEDLDLLLKLVGATACRGAPFSITTWTLTKRTPCSVLHLQASSEEGSEMREQPPVGGPSLLKTTRNPMATPNHFWAAIWV